MDFDWRTLLIQWTIRLAMVGYGLGLVGLLRQHDRWARWAWSAGYLAFLAHVYVAFKYAYGFSHTHAFDQTALATELAIGVRFGWGIWFNYLFILVWAFDLAWWWLGGHARYRARRRAAWAIHGYMLLIMFCGAVVFVDTPLRWLYLLGFGGLAACAWYRFKPLPDSESAK